MKQLTEAQRRDLQRERARSRKRIALIQQQIAAGQPTYLISPQSTILNLQQRVDVIDAKLLRDSSKEV